jgi:hypothetical protein
LGSPSSPAAACAVAAASWWPVRQPAFARAARSLTPRPHWHCGLGGGGADARTPPTSRAAPLVPGSAGASGVGALAAHGTALNPAAGPSPVGPLVGSPPGLVDRFMTLLVDGNATALLERQVQQQAREIAQLQAALAAARSDKVACALDETRRGPVPLTRDPGGGGG